ncbi:efflux RND transporter periplasmic adaptor subunit [Marmoricola sp. RAF53]|uniref:efflux RND transporter periplasmic adaptor subunit n=1 Tax=Marmoricola sp. RAF53 TaxID=3233059 RepID=UPI003F96CB0E
MSRTPIAGRIPGLIPGRLRAVRRRWWVVVAAVLVLAGAGAWFGLASGDDSAGVQRITATVATGTYKDTVSASGTITPKKEADVAFTSSGTVTAVEVAVGDKVTRGDVLARIDDDVLVAQRAAAQAQVDAAQSQLSEDSGASSTQVAADEAALASARSQLAEAADAVGNATLRAPFAGTVSVVGYAVGDTVGGSTGGNGSAAAGGSDGATAAITVITPRRLLVEANVSAADVSRLKTGMQAEITPTGGGDVVYGTVTEVGVIASASSSGAAQFPVTIEVTGTPAGLYPGSSATVAITVKQATDVLAVPTAALHSDADGTTYVYVVRDGKRVRTTVKTGTAYGAQTEVLSGVKAGDEIEVVTISGQRGTGTNRNRQGGNLTFPGGAELPGGGQLPPGGFSGQFSGSAG